MAIKKKKTTLKAKKKIGVIKKTAGKKPVRKGVKNQRKKVSKKQRELTRKFKESIIGTVTHYFPKVRAAAVKLKAALALGDTVRIKGYTTDFTQKVISLQIDRVVVNSAKKRDEVGLLVDSRVRKGDKVCKE